MTAQQTTVKRFIAGAVCPRCGMMDRLRCWRDDVREHRECVHCEYSDSMRLDGAADPAELPTRVNHATEATAPKTAHIPLVQISPAEKPEPESEPDAVDAGARQRRSTDS